MTITIAPFKVNPSCNYLASRVRHEEEAHLENNHPPITYWGIYLDDKYISYTSSKDLAEKTKIWMEKWLGDIY
ncbi:MAG TPA: hypothetical protein VNN20_12450 [Thermodesulfobacteriota bacterium]|nr:hypothetical protein [Thermodesulfobacteriota bacterium]